MLPVDGEAEPFAVERLGELMIENPKEWDWRLKSHLKFVAFRTRQQRLTRHKISCREPSVHAPQHTLATADTPSVNRRLARGQLHRLVRRFSSHGRRRCQPGGMTNFFSAHL